jgi:hypothetical protein
MIEPPWLDRSAYPFAHNAMDLSAARMHSVDEGTGPPILLVHDVGLTHPLVRIAFRGA